MTDKKLINGIVAALENKPSANFSANQVNEAAINGIMEACGLTKDSKVREIRAKQGMAFALIEEAIDEVLPIKLQAVLGEFAEIKQFPRDAEVVFNIEKIGRQRAKLTIAKGARGGIYRAARLDSKWFSPAVQTYTVAVYVTLEELILGTQTLADLYNNVLEGLEEIVYKEVFNALATGAPVTGYSKITAGVAPNAAGNLTATTAEALHTALDKVLPYVKQFGTPTIFGSYKALSALANPGIDSHVTDTEDYRNYGFVQVYKGVRVVELPNYIVSDNQDDWIYDQKYVFVIPASAKPVKVALKGELLLQINQHAVGSEEWNAHKIMGIGLAMANNYAVIEVDDGIAPITPKIVISGTVAIDSDDENPVYTKEVTEATAE